MTMTLVETIEVGAGGAASIEFTSIPQDADDLLLVVNSRTDYVDVAYPLYLVFNNDNSSTYTNKILRGTGSVAESVNVSTTAGAFMGQHPGSSATANTFGNGITYIANYTSSAAKSISSDLVGENNATSARATLTASSYPGTSAVTSLKLAPLLSNFVQYSTASLYKITKA